MAYSENPSRVMVFPDGNSGNGIGGYAEVPPHMRGYVVRPEDEDWMYNERYNW